MKQYKIRILTFEGGTFNPWVEETITVKRMWTSSAGYYNFEDEDGKQKYYPVNNTIIEEI